MWNSKLVKKLVWFFFFPFPPAHSLLVCPCSIFQPGLDPPFPALPHSHWTGPVLCLAEKSQTSSSDRTLPLLPAVAATTALAPPGGLCRSGGNSKGQSRPRQGLAMELIWEFWGFLFTSDQTNTKPRVMVATATSQSPGSTALWAQEPFQLQAVTLSLLTWAAASWQWHTADFAWFCFCCAKNA